MPRVSGIFNLPSSYKATSGQTIRTEQHNPPLEDIAQALTDSLPRDGSAPMQARLPMNGQRITGLGAAVNASDALRKDQAVAYSAWLASLGGLTMANNRLPYATGPNTAALTPLTPMGRDLLDDVNAGEMRTTLGLKGGATTDKATTPQAVAGSNDSTFMTPKTTKEAIAANAFTLPRTAGAVDTYAFLSRPTFGVVNFGDDYSGASLRTSAVLGGSTGGNVSAGLNVDTGSVRSGTWRCMGNGGGVSAYPATNFLRIS